MTKRCDNESVSDIVSMDMGTVENANDHHVSWAFFHEKFSGLVERLGLAYLEVDRNFQVVDWAGSAPNIWGMTRDETRGRGLSDLLLPENSRAWFNDFLSLVLNEAQEANDVFKHTVDDSRDILCEWFFSPILNPDGEVSGISMVVRDITQNIMADHELERYRRSGLSRIFKSAPIGIYQADMDGTFINVNPELAWMLGYESAESMKEERNGLGKGFFADDTKRREFFFYIMEAEQVNHFKSQVVKKDGTKIWSLSHAQITQNETGRPNGFFGFLIDISSSVKAAEDLKQAKEIAELATKAKSDFLANMSHEIRTPLNAIIGFTNLVLKSELDEKQRDYISKVGISGRALLGIINDILDFSKIEAGKLELESTVFALHDLLNNLSDMFANSVIEKKIELIISASPLVPDRLKGDPVRLNQILINLINNAIKFTKKGEVVVWVSLVERNGDHVKLQFSVSDTGIGMTAEQRSRLFESFSQADTSTTRKFGGTGLGLSISKRLVELMNGKIWVKSEAEMGSTFAFHVTMESSSGAGERLEVPQRLNGLHILVQDENPAIREVVMMILICYSFRVRAAASADETLAELERAKNEGTPYDMVIVNWQHDLKRRQKSVRLIREWERVNRDTMMPILGKRFPDKHQDKRLPIVLTLDFGQEEERKMAENEGASSFVFKPIKQTQLVNVILKSFGSNPLYLTESLHADEIGEEIRRVIHGACVLLVDDNDINLEVATETMKQQGIVVDCADSGAKALEKIMKKGRVKSADGKVVHPYDAVLMDLQMPEMDGYQTTQRIREWENSQDNTDNGMEPMPVIAMSAHALTSEIEKCRESGMNDYVAKPIEPKALFSQLAKWIQPVTRVLVPFEKSEMEVSHKDDETNIKNDGVLRLEGVDTESGLLKVAGNKELYVRLLGKFFNGNRQSAASIESALDNGSFDVVKHIAHTIKGVAGNLGMTGLFEVSARLEQAVKDQDIPQAVERFTLFSHEMNTVLTSIETMNLSLGLGQDMSHESDPDICEVEGDPSSQKILVVDDVPENIDILMELLKSDYRVTGVLDGEKALELTRGKQVPDIILLDVNMPGISGFDVCRILKEQDETKDIPVIFITAETEVTDQARGFDLGAVDYITKPVVPAIVKMRVKTQLELKRQRDILERMSTIDGLTQIANRRRFDDILARDWRRCLRNNNQLSLVLMDIDHFKQFNDRYGHQAGDECLKKVASALVTGCMRETDLVARYGGEEFVAVLPDTDYEGALLVAERMRDRVSVLDILHEGSSAASYVTVSQGVVSLIPDTARTIKQFIEMADECLYEAKKTGRNRAVARRIV